MHFILIFQRQQISCIVTIHNARMRSRNARLAILGMKRGCRLNLIAMIYLSTTRRVKNFSLSLTTKREFDLKINALLSDNPSQALYVNVSEKPKKRSLSANAQQHVFYKQISEFSATDIKTCECECKIDFGLPIILSDPEVGRVIGYALENARFFSMTRERQVKFIQVIQITSLMNTKQHNQYRENIIYFWNTAGLNLGYKD